MKLLSNRSPNPHPALVKFYILLAPILIIILMTLIIFHQPAYAQDAPPQAEYVVQSGDSLWGIAARFRVSLADLLAANGLPENAFISAGQRLKIPGLQGISGTVTTLPLPYGENLNSLSKRYNLDTAMLAQLNHITSPNELYAGMTLIMLEDRAAAQAAPRRLLRPGQSLLEMAALTGSNPWQLAQTNGLTTTISVLPGQVLQAGQAISTTAATPGALPEDIAAVILLPDPIVQGQTASLEVQAADGLNMQGRLVDHTFTFFPDGAGRYAGLQGIHALTPPGLYSLVISGTLADGAPFAFSQGVLVAAGDYPFDPVLTVAPETIDPAVTEPENAEWAAISAPVTPEKLWQGQFGSPAAPIYAECWPSRYGNRRSYNGSAYTYFHTGLDFCGGVGADILAPAAGKVVFAGPLTVRGNATVINHGWGVYSAYLHQSQILVQVGDMVTPGQVIGKVGGTGRVTGPHLHWEIWVNGLQVDPMQWLESAFPLEAAP
jgi:murein DD-endopeptidase MepM/ murein hydrolase activator NlpD